MSIVNVVFMYPLGSSLMLEREWGPSKVLKLNDTPSSRTSEQSRDIAVAREGRRRMTDENLVRG